MSTDQKSKAFDLDTPLGIINNTLTVVALILIKAGVDRAVIDSSIVQAQQLAFEVASGKKSLEFAVPPERTVH